MMKDAAKKNKNKEGKITRAVKFLLKCNKIRSRNMTAPGALHFFLILTYNHYYYCHFIFHVMSSQISLGEC